MSDPLEHLERWRQAGLVDDELAARIRSFEGGSRPAPEERPVASRSPDDRPGIIEALLYLGFIVAGCGVLFLVGQQWEEFTSWARIAVVAVPAVLAFVAGLALARFDEGGLRRAGSVAWLLTVCLVAGTVAVVFNEADPGEVDGSRAFLVTAAVTLVVALALWALNPSTLQVFGVGGAAFFFGEALGAWPDDYSQRVAGVAILVAGVLLLGLTEAGYFRPRPVARVAAGLLTGAGAYHAGLGSAVGWETLAFIAGAGLAILGVVRSSFTYVALAVGTLLVALITFMFEHFEDEIGAPVALVISGGLLIAAVLVLVQVRSMVRSRRRLAA